MPGKRIGAGRGRSGMNERERIAGLVNRLGRIAHSLQFAEGLNPAQWEALRYLARANRSSATPGALADFMGTTRGSVSQTLKALEAKGLVRRVPHPGDRRSARLALTVAGRGVLERDPLDSISDALGRCSEADQVSLAAGMERLLDAVRDHHGFPEFGDCRGCAHFMPERCVETRAVGCRCGVSGELFGALELDRICVHFSRLRPAARERPRAG